MINKKDIINNVNIFIIGKICFDKYKNNFDENEFDINYKYRYFSLLLIILYRKFVPNHKNRKNNLSFKILENVLKVSNQDSRIIKQILNNFDDFIDYISTNEYNKENAILLLKNINVQNISQIILIAVSEEFTLKNNNDNIMDKFDYNYLDNIFKKYFKFLNL